jgi:hypothetical protein
MCINEFKKRWVPPPSIPTQKRCCTPLPHPKHLMYYPLYGGYHSGDLPILFKNPSHALMWALSRFKKDGLGNSWAQLDQLPYRLPYFMRFIGVLECKTDSFTRTIIPTSSKPSKIETYFFSEVQFFAVLNQEALSRDLPQKYLRILKMKHFPSA